MVWDLLVIAVTIIVCLVYTYQAAFTHFKPPVSFGAGVAGKVLFALTYILDAVLLADIFVSMKKAIVTPNGELSLSQQALSLDSIDPFPFHPSCHLFPSFPPTPQRW